MNSKRLLQLRLAQGLTLEGLSSRMGGMVTKQSLSKYEKGLAMPRPSVLSMLAEVLGVKMAYFLSDPQTSVEIIAYRKKTSLSVSEKNRVENLVTATLEKRVELQKYFDSDSDFNFPIRSIKANSFDDVEKAAENIRNICNLGTDPIASVTDVLESCKIHVIEIEADKKFDGISAVVQDSNGKNISAAVVSRCYLSGERQRLNLAHELGHLVLELNGELDPEKAAYTFGSSFLVPSKTLKDELGKKRSSITLQELLFLKRKYGISVQALLYRMRDLCIISENYLSEWFKLFSKMRWRKSEPEEIATERSSWLHLHTMRAYAEGFIGSSDVENLLGNKLDEFPNSLMKRKAFMNLTVTERAKLLSDQANGIHEKYSPENYDLNIGAEDVIEY